MNLKKIQKAPDASKRELEILKGCVAILKKHLNPARVYLFGSRAKEINHPHADFDIAADARKPGTKIQKKIEDEIEKIAGLYSVDVIYLKSVEEKFKDVVLETGKVIYVKRD